ncbi:MAG TPA: glycosyltransferase, partial [Candidatus Limnocylindria bacterium]|nr:glycosyltransferase [Candidatus Limnocylindria bacterium]
MKVALAHEYFSVHGGAEAVVEVFHAMWPDAPVYTFFHDRKRYGELPGWRVVTSTLQGFPIGGGLHRLLLPLYPTAARHLRVPSDVDVALVSTSAFIKGLALAEATVEVAYCHSPTRYLWDWTEQYLDEEVPPALHRPVRELLAHLRDVDRDMAQRVDQWVANSAVVAERIRRFYGRESEVLHPPVAVDGFEARPERGDHWLFVGRLSAYKRADVAVRAFARSRRRLIVVGEGRERDALERLATDNIVFTGRVDDATKRDLLASARGLVFPAEDDFGIVCAEALASGAPVVALARGGAPEIVRDGLDGALFAEADAEQVAAAVDRVDAQRWDPQALRTSARRFDVGRFRDRIGAIVESSARSGR